jgi:acyl-CoA dehydrogenase
MGRDYDMEDDLAARQQALLDTPDEHQEIRDAVRDLCSQFPDAYFRQIDEQRGYPEAFVDALIGAGWLAAMIPEEYGGSGLA